MPTKKPRYCPHPGLSREAAAMEKIRATTGRSYEEWVAITKKNGPKDKDACWEWLRTKHGFSPRYAWWIVSADDRPLYDDPGKLVDALYSGPRAALRPLHEKIVDAALALGDDVVVTACKTMVPFYRKHVFAQAKPIDGGVELALALGDTRSKRFEKLTMPGDRLSHRTVLRSPKDLDADFQKALQAAYEAGAGKIARAAGEPGTPGDLDQAIKGKARATWDSCTPAMKRDIILWIESAKQADTRARRIDRAVEKLTAGQKKMY